SSPRSPRGPGSPLASSGEPPPRHETREPLGSSRTTPLTGGEKVITEAHRWLVTAATVAVAAVAVAGCGSSSSSKTQTTGAAGGGTTAAAATSAAGTTSTAAGTGSGSGGAGADAVTDYLKYVDGKAGKADASLPPVTIGWINQQGGQQAIGPLATSGAQM